MSIQHIPESVHQNLDIELSNRMKPFSNTLDKSYLTTMREIAIFDVIANYLKDKIPIGTIEVSGYKGSYAVHKSDISIFVTRIS